VLQAMDCAPLECPEPDPAPHLLGKRPMAHGAPDERDHKRLQLH
jgi:hypothetical protein